MRWLTFDKAVAPATEIEWVDCEEPLCLLKPFEFTATERKLRLMAVSAVHLLWDRIPFDWMREAVEMSERCADGSQEEATLKGHWSKLYDVWKDGTELRSWYTAGDNKFVEAAVSFATCSPRLMKLQPGGSAMWTMVVDYLRGSICPLIRDIFGNPFRPVEFDPTWNTDTVVTLVRTMYNTRDFSGMPILADALQEAGCEEPTVLGHCRGEGPHVRGCWVVDGILGRK